MIRNFELLLLLLFLTFLVTASLAIVLQKFIFVKDFAILIIRSISSTVCTAYWLCSSTLCFLDIAVYLLSWSSFISDCTQ